MAKRASRKPKKKAAGKKKKATRKKPKRTAGKKKKITRRKPKRTAVRKKKTARKTRKKKSVARKRRPRPARAKKSAARKKKSSSGRRITSKPDLVISPPRPTSPPIPGVNEQRVGRVIHYYSHLGVAVVRMERGSLVVGDTIHIQGHTSNFRQRVESMEVEHQKIPRSSAGQEFGLKVIEHAREHDLVFKVGRTS